AVGGTPAVSTSWTSSAYARTSPSCRANRSSSDGVSARFARAAMASTCARVNPAAMANASMAGMPIRRAAVAGSWYPGSASALAAAVDRHLANTSRDVEGELVALVAPHAGLMYSGPVAAHAYRLLRGRRFDVAVLVGPSHFVGFDGVAVVPSGGFETPFGVAAIDEPTAAELTAASPLVREHPAAHAREHSLEMQLPLLQHLAPGTPIVPLVMGYQTRDTARALGDGLASVLRSRHAVAIASTDLSQYRDAGA